VSIFKENTRGFPKGVHMALSYSLLNFFKAIYKAKISSKKIIKKYI